ncbi:16S rRNA (cytidine(1402)-2'-O)-methyltransferase [Egicoccus halophilus]|uniref:Ribosomal RNA small subunit methyltransferase I n=1 Tax=Egicoccus halophilus TaxID=1670830 RepID=A0A8J3A833_9ACTN|nr:16S rRNA (cytidine(1402)-2'-O)-methyltransferase [Egicoccus halophilus]GGI03689.1 ribosomal RNA small subunit methyltransferase I [Egicoccus halophilus]
MSGTLVVVATPIGNLGDLSPRAAEALCSADLVLAEDTRRTGRLLQHVGSGAPQRSLHEHNERERIGDVLEQLRAGARIALVSDAGTPTVSDPGYRLLAACAEAELAIEVVPGPSAALAALVLAALPTDRVAFEGFLPRKGAARRGRLAELTGEPRTMVLFVSPHRAAADLADLAGALGPQRPAALTRELTKLHEQVVRAPLGVLAERVADDGVRGEVTLVVAGAPASVPEPVGEDALVARVQALLATGMAKKAAIAEVATSAGVPKKVVYQAVVDAGS